ncbi:tRNA (guanosine(37)-N1)-methyltransferase TrmD [Herbinix luporum]|jgi:tRNA (guanine37-N1)-methyltransferase|uniref:tRNA (guanosine(37)-N1)-methyltransferase TrmD n=1 Tax=Herbinix luporum TaxID=1679721 RepID=UPI001761039D|nr:tRNA (guanosine(37)-N1)-methyltransferase TrmD [Herbinix luporum]HHT56696.1 tRNA (guanosine(37)-N1)-methyltransferase TrmD [Herbinix luporum]
MNFHVLTLFPEMIENTINTSITKRAIEKGLISVNAVNIRDFSSDKHKRVDDYPYGGGAGMVIQAEPVYKAYEYLVNHIKSQKKDQSSLKKPRVIYVTPQGKIFNQTMAQELSLEEDLIFLCGHYEGIDERVLEMIVTDNISIGDYILTGGELPALVMIDSIARLIPGVLNNEASSEFESLKDNLLEYPQYTRPEVFMGRKVPEVLLSGHHAKIEEYRRKQSILRTFERRPDLLENAVLTKEEREYLTGLIFQKNYEAYE